LRSRTDAELSPRRSVAFGHVIPVRDDLRVLEGYHSPQVDVRVRLNTNESPLPPPAAFRDALAAEMSRIEWHRYPDRQATELREAIAEWHGVTPDMVFAANGSNEVLQTILLTYAGPGRRVATFEPTYQMHAQIARVVGSHVVEGERDHDFTLDPAEMRRVVASADPHVTFLTSPNNPTGLVEPADRVVDLLALTNGLVVADEAYAQFADWSALTLVDEARPLVVTRTFSKTWSMAGVRLGYAIGPTWFVRELDKVVLPYHLDTAKQIAGRLALRFVSDMDERVRLIVSERERLASTMGAMEIDVTPSGANFILFRPREMRGRDLWQALLDRSVLVRDCSGWPRLADRLRVTVGTPDDDPQRHAPPRDQGDVDRGLDRPRRIRCHGCLDRHPVLRPHARPAGTSRWVRPDGESRRRPPHRHPPHGRGRRDHAG
jgi:histidinol-phosphate aminotransferase